MKVKNLLVFFIITLLILSAAYVAVYGINIGKWEVVPVKQQIKLGLDLRGGVTVILEAKDTPNDPVDDKKMERAIATIRQRIDSLGVTEPVIAQQGKKRIEVQLPEVKDPQRALEIIGKTAQLEFREESGTVVLTGNDIKKAEADYSSSDGLGQQPVVALELTSEGAKKFAEATSRNVGKIIGIYLDDQPISLPTVQNAITEGKAVITGSSSIEEAADLATLIRAGALPVELTTLSVTAVGPQLGADSFEKSIAAGQIGIILVLLFMLIYYRVPGLVSDITLSLYTVIVLVILASFKATLTLPGIAGIILSIGMAVDANVIIFERIKEELRIGKTIRAAIDSGFRRAFLTIFDSNITTLIAAAVLFYFGTGPIKGFAVTLSIGILSSMFTAIVVTRFMLKLLVGSNMIKNMKLFGL